MITFEEIKRLMALAAQKKYGLEILFCVNGSEVFDQCWMGRLYDEADGDVYWLGLTPDGKNGFDYPTFEELSAARAFNGSSLFEIWDKVELLEINACEPRLMLDMYLSEGECK